MNRPFIHLFTHILFFEYNINVSLTYKQMAASEMATPVKSNTTFVFNGTGSARKQGLSTPRVLSVSSAQTPMRSSVDPVSQPALIQKPIVWSPFSSDIPHRIRFDLPLVYRNTVDLGNVSGSLNASFQQDATGLSNVSESLNASFQQDATDLDKLSESLDASFQEDLTEMYLTEMHLDDATYVADAARKSTHLTTLHISFDDATYVNNIGALFLELSDLSELENIHISNTYITDSDATCLSFALRKRCKTLTSLTLSNTHIGTIGMQRLVKSIGLCESLTDLDLNQNKLDYPTAVELLSALAAFKKLESIVLSGNIIGDVTMTGKLESEYLNAKVFSNLRFTALEDNRPLSDRIKADAITVAQYLKSQYDLATNEYNSYPYTDFPDRREMDDNYLTAASSLVPYIRTFFSL